MDTYHKSVLLKEVIEILNVKKDSKYIDATLGGGGHSFEILRQGGRVLGLDVDVDALDYVEEKLKTQNLKLKIGKEYKIVRGNFGDIKNIAERHGFGRAAGIIFDLGVSSHQIDTAERGFSFRKAGPLDMRMDRDLKVKAGDLVNILTKGELYELFTKLGEEGFARAIANNIVKSRRVKAIQTTEELTEIINRTVGNFKLRQDATARIYQALRIAVNDELNSLRVALPKAYDLLEKNGIIVVISFHSLEDRIVKGEFAKWEEEKKGIVLTKKPIMASGEEVGGNSRSASGKLRAFQRN